MQYQPDAHGPARHPEAVRAGESGDYGRGWTIRITDDRADLAMLERFRNAGVNVLVAATETAGSGAVRERGSSARGRRRLPWPAQPG